MEKANNNPLRSLYYHITNRCNLKCRHCWVRGGEELLDDEIVLADVIDIINQSKKLGLRGILLTGGEPLLVSWLPAFIRFLSSNNISIALETNGTLITSEVAKLFAENGVDSINVSLDGACASSHEYLRGVPGCFDQTISGIKNLGEVGICPPIMVAVHKGNLKELADIGLLASEFGVKKIKLNCIQGPGRATSMELNDEILDYDARVDLFNSLEELERISGVEFKLWMPPALKSITKMKCHLASGCNVANTIGLLPNGDFALCGIAITSPELAFDNFRDCSVAEIWNNNPIIAEISRSVPDKLEGACAECIFKTTCKGGCRAIAYIHSGSLLGSDPICQQAKDNGKFPPSRLLKKGVFCN